MSKKRITGIALLVGAVLVLVVGGIVWLNGHDKSGMGLLGLGVILIGVGTFTFFSRASAEKVRLDREWM
ncbi:MAG TPA: hypothetical protein VFQ36_11560 [Ktedonobacteraceae bacterium]|nr:hypothetical protein [Ktedonobacteraceae bacterium]